jgi:hypothetical protein
LASVRVAKMTSSIVLTAALPQVIWSLGSGRMTMLVLVSLAAIVDAMTGLGKIPIQIKNGSRPCSGVTVGQTAEASAAAGAAAAAPGKVLPMNELKASVAMPGAMFGIMANNIVNMTIRQYDKANYGFRGCRAG